MYQASQTVKQKCRAQSQRKQLMPKVNLRSCEILRADTQNWRIEKGYNSEFIKAKDQNVEKKTK